jgi:NTE family protein
LQHQDKINISNVIRTGGTSAGSIVAALYAVYNGDYDSMKELMSGDFSKFEDFTPFGKKVYELKDDFTKFEWWKLLRIIQNIDSVYDDLVEKFEATKTGIWAGDAFKQWLEDAIDVELKNNDLNITSKTLSFKKIHETDYFKIDPFVVGTNLNTGYPVVFSYLNTPDMLIVDAVRISMSIPIFFEPIELPVPINGGQKNCLFVDGGVVWNYPIELFDQKQFIPDFKPDPYANLNANPKTLGLKLDSEENIKILQNPQILKHDGGLPAPTNGMEYALYLLDDLMNSQNFSMLLFSRNENRTVNISGCGIQGTNFKLTPEQEQQLFNSGVKGVNNFISRT